MLVRVERMQRAFARPAGPAASFPVWEPPADILETETDVIVLVALPGVDPDRTDVVIEGDDLVVSGTRVLPPELRNAVIHRLELPQGRFERRLPLPPGRYGNVRRSSGPGYLVVVLRKAESSLG
jgi:HSP20 family molecular chaperone IbpA